MARPPEVAFVVGAGALSLASGASRGGAPPDSARPVGAAALFGASRAQGVGSTRRGGAGALIVFQSPANTPKLVYLGLAAICLVLSASKLRRDSDPVVRAFRPVLVPAIAFGVVLLGSGLIAHGQGARTEDWVRDVLPYFLLITLPIVGLDGSRDLGARSADWLVTGAGLLATVGFALDWVNRRGVAASGVGRVFLATIVLASLGFCYMFVQAGTRRRWWAWLALAMLTAACLLVSGNRANAVIAIGVLGMVGSPRKARLRVTWLVGLTAVAVLGTVAMVRLLASWLIADPTFLSRRLADALSVLHGNASSDRSFEIRQISYAYSRQQFHAHPWLGGGPGHLYPTGTFTLDSPWLVPAKFGIVGSFLLLVYLVSIVLSVRQRPRANRVAEHSNCGACLGVHTRGPDALWAMARGQGGGGWRRDYRRLHCCICSKFAQPSRSVATPSRAAAQSLIAWLEQGPGQQRLHRVEEAVPAVGGVGVAIGSARQGLPPR